MLTSDHGEGLGQHGWKGHGRIWNEQLFVPLMIKYPAGSGIRPGRRPYLVSLIDVLPTLVASLKLPLATTDLAQMVGDAVLSGPSNRDWTFVQRTPKERRRLWGTGQKFSLVSADWKYHHATDSVDELYDMRADPDELENLIDVRVSTAELLQHQLLEGIETVSSSGVGLDVLEEISPEAIRELRALGLHTVIPRSAGRAVSGARGRNVVRLAVGCVTITCLAQPLAPAVPAQASETGSVPDQPSFIVVVTDDQRWDSLWAMPFVNEDLRARAVDFTNAFVTTPTCCPSRASFLSGGFYAHNTGVLTNKGPNGGVTKFDDTRSMPLKLQRAGYRTALIGKYLNGYNALAPYIPPGWTRFVGNTFTGDWLASRVVVGSSGRASSRGSEMTVDGHLVEFQFDEAIRFLKDNEGLPFFLLLSLAAPHKPATPATNNTTLFQNFQYRGRGLRRIQPERQEGSYYRTLYHRHKARGGPKKAMVDVPRAGCASRRRNRATPPAGARRRRCRAARAGSRAPGRNPSRPACPGVCGCRAGGPGAQPIFRRSAIPISPSCALPPRPSRAASIGRARRQQSTLAARSGWARSGRGSRARTPRRGAGTTPSTSSRRAFVDGGAG